MKLSWVSALLTLASLAGVCGVAVQHRQLVSLRSEQEQLVAQLAAESSGVAPSPAISVMNASPKAESSDLLRLRNEVNQLTQQKRALSNVSNEHVRLVAELAARQTNGGFPVGYIRKKDARLAGYNTPEDTIQSFLWALQNHDLTNLLETMTPTMAQQMGFTRPDKSAEDMFKEMDMMPGMRVVSKKPGADDMMEVEVEVVPGADPMRLRLRLSEGRWQISQEQ